MTATWPQAIRLVTALLAIALVGCAVLHPLPASAADRADWPALANTVFRSVGEDGITSATAIVEDGEGFLWAGGQSGLSRWDGYRLKTYGPDPQVAGSLPDAFINTLLTDRRGRLWIGTTSGGLARYEPDSDRFITYAAGRTGPSSNTISALAGVGDGLWIGTSQGLDFRADRTGEFRHYRHEPRDARSLPDNVVTALLIDHRGALWAATEGGLVRAEPGTTHFDPIRLSAARREVPIPLSLFEDSRQRVWIGTRRHGLFVVGADGRTARAVHGHGAREPRLMLDDGTIQAINEPRPGKLWLGTFDHGILSLDVATGLLGWIHNEPNLATSLPQNSVGSIFRDRAGVIWVGTLGGLSRYDAQQRTFATIFIASSALGGISSPDVTAIYAPPAGSLWLGYGSDGVDRLDPIRGRVGTLRPNAASPQTTLPDSATRTIAGVPGGPVFIGTERGLFRTDATGRDVRMIPLKHGRSGDDVDAIGIADGRLWIGTAADGLWSMDLRAGSVPARVKSEPLTDNRILSIAPASEGRLWVGTYRGLNLVDTRSGAVEQIPAEADDPNRLANDFISALLVDRDGHVWVGSFGGGLAVMTGRDRMGRPRFMRLGTGQGLPNANVDSLAADRLGHVWVATDNGLAVVDATTHTVRPFDRTDGVELPSYYLGSTATLPNGDIAFGANRGITIVHPDRLHDWRYLPPLVVTEARTGGHVVPANRFNGPDASSSLIVQPDANSVAVEFAALDYTAADRNRYAYRLTGFDSDWIETDASRRLAAYTNLPPGDYVLELRGSNRNGAWSTARVSIPVHVVPAWHQTLAVHIAECLLAVLCVAALVQMRTAVARRHERELEQQVAQRTAELREREHQLRMMAYRDALTNLPNRRAFNDECRRMIAAARRQGEEIALLLIDLDRFKNVNDTLGHDAGDALLVEAASRLAGLVRESDCVARLGGDEFVILLGAGRDNAAIEAVCDRITSTFDTPVQFGSAALKTTPSIGLAMFPQHGNSPDQLYKSADLALYAAKLAGRNTWRRATLEPA